MVAPEIVVVERLEVFADGDHGGSSGVERDRAHIATVDVGITEGEAHRGDQRVHVRGMRLRREVRILAVANDRIFDDTGADGRTFTVDDGDANALRAEIDPGDDWHPLSGAAA